MQAPLWCSKYIGIPYVEAGRDPAVGLDCWGLLVHVMRDQFGVPVPWYMDVKWRGRDGAKALGDFMVAESSIWTPVWVKSSRNEPLPADVDARPGDGLLIRMDGVPTHVGVVAQNPWFLHTEVGLDCCLDEMTSSRWNRRILGVYRYEERNVTADGARA